MSAGVLLCGVKSIQPIVQSFYCHQGSPIAIRLSNRILREGRGEKEVTGEQFVRMEASLFILVRPPDNDNPSEL